MTDTDDIQHDIEQRFIDLADAEKKPPAYVINDLVPVGLTLLAGPPKVSHKSTVAIIKALLCARMACPALPKWAHAILGGPVMLISAEADAGEVKFIVEDGLRVTLERGSIYVAHDTWDFQLDDENKGNQLLDDLRARDARMAILDPMRNLWSGDENESKEVIQILRPLRDWAHESEAALIVVHHINKPPTVAMDTTTTAGMYTMRGSSAIPGLADGILVIEPTRTEGQITINATFKRGASWRRTIQLGVPGFGWPSEGYEVIHDQALALADMWGTVPHDMTFMEKAMGTLKLQVGAIRRHFDTLRRNEIIEMNPLEERMFLFPHEDVNE